MEDDFNFQELDMSWIHDFEKEDDLYKDFYLEDLYFINVHYVYLNEFNTIEKVKKDKYFFNEFYKNILPKEELFKIIIKNKNLTNEKYKLNCLFKYNCTIDPYIIIAFLKNKTLLTLDPNNCYLSPITSIENVQFKKTITMFQDLNSISIIYQKISAPSGTSNPNITPNPSNINPSNTNINIKTKKLYIKKYNRKTRRFYI
jgi:hypothetical protein